MKTRLVKLVLEEIDRDAETSFTYVRTKKSNEEIETLFNKYIKDWENTTYDKKIDYQLSWAEIIGNVAQKIGMQISEDELFTTFKKVC